MIYVFVSLAISLSQPSSVEKIYSFGSQTNINEWRIVNDGVMGGISTSSLVRTDEGYAKFSGHVSLANNGGFASIQLNTPVKLAKEKKFIILRVKGDGKRYEFRMKGDLSQAESYVHSFPTSGKWENIKLPISEFYPSFRGRQLSMPNFNFDSIEQLSFLIANKQEEDFELVMDWIGVE